MFKGLLNGGVLKDIWLSLLLQCQLFYFFYRFNPNITSSGGEKYDKARFERKDQQIK